MELLPNKAEHELKMLEELAQLARPHAEASSSLELLPIDPDKYPAQLSLHIEGDPQSAAVIESIATIAEPRFSKLTEVLEEREARTQEISRIGELLKGGNNLVIATNHGNLIDIALVEAAVYSILDKQNYKFKTGIIISKMVAMLAFKLGEDAAPCADVLKLLCDDVFLSFPRSDSIRKSRFSILRPGEIDKHNKTMRNMVKQKLDDGGMLLALAPSGSKDKESQSEPGTYTLGPLGSGTLALMTHPRTYVLPIAIWLEGEEPFMEVCDIPKLITKDEDAHEMMDVISNSLSRGVEGINFCYSTPKNIGRTALI
jgi:hypothetical protein